MGIEFDWANSKSSEGDETPFGGCDLPASNDGDHIMLFVFKWEPPFGGSPTVGTPVAGAVTATVWPSVGSVSVFRFPAGTTGNARFTFSSVCSFFAVAVAMSGAAASPASSGTSASQTGFTHTVIASTTAPHVGAVLVGCAGVVATDDLGALFLGADNTVEKFYVNYVDLSGAVFRCGGSIAIRYAENAGDAGAHTWTSRGGGLFNPGSLPNSVTSSLLAFWVSPLQAPSAPRVTAPATNGKFTVGSTQRITYEGASDPNVDSEDLIYKIYVSNNHGITYTLLTTTAAGVLFYDWDTTSYGPGTWMVKVVANNGTDDGQPGYSGEFQLFADVPPGAPNQLSPTGYITQAARDFTWVGNFPDFDNRLAYNLRYSSNPDMSAPTTVGKTTSAIGLHNFSASSGILSSLGTKYWQVADYGEVDDTQGAWSSPATVIVAAAPATPTITSSSTANTAFWTLTFTAIAHTQFRVRLVLSGNSRLNTIVQSSAFNFTTPFELADGEVWDVYISVFDPVTGLESAEAHQTLTVTYTGPATPTIDVVVLNDIGAFQISVTNSVPADIDHTRLFVSHNGGDYQLVSPKLGPNALYLYHHGANDLHADYNEYVFKARSFKVTTLGFSDSAPSSNLGLTLTGLHIHVVEKASTTSNAGLKVNLLIEGPIIKRFIKKHRSVPMKGREKYITYAGVFKQTVLVYNCVIARNDTTTFPALKACFDANRTLCFRDSDHNKIFGRIFQLPSEEDLATNRFSLVCEEESFTEVYTR